MATRIKRPPARLYEEDFHEWALEQARLLRERRFEELDLDNLIEEVDDLARRDLQSVRSRVRTVIEHLLKLEHSPLVEPRAGWRATIRTQRSDLADDLTPSLRRLVEADLARLYTPPRDNAAGALRDHGEDAVADSLPDTCPYTLDQIMGDWLP
jgi:hypothetical protein